MASSQVEISSAAFGCVLRDHNSHDRCRESNVRAAQAAFEKNLKVLVRDHLNNCIDQKSSGDNPVVSCVASNICQPDLKCKSTENPEPSPKSMKQSNQSSAASSLVQIWEARLNHPNANQTSSRTNSGLTENSGSGTFNDEPQMDGESEYTDDNRQTRNEETDWEVQSDRTVQSDSLSVADSAESERLRVADIIRRLSDHEQLNITNNSSVGATENPVRERRPNVSSALEQTVDPRCFAQVLSSPRIRGRQAFADLLMQIERDRQKELELLAERRAVSKFMQKGRLQSMLRIRCLERCIAIQDHHRSKSAAPDMNRLSQVSAVTHKREKFKTGAENCKRGQRSDSANSKSPRFEMTSNVVESKGFSLSLGRNGDNHHVKDTTSEKPRACTAEDSRTQKPGLKKSGESDRAKRDEEIKRGCSVEKSASQNAAGNAQETSSRSITSLTPSQNERKRKEDETSRKGFREKAALRCVNRAADSDETEVKTASPRSSKKGETEKYKKESAGHCVVEKNTLQEAATKTMFRRSNETDRAKKEQEIVKRCILEKKISQDAGETNNSLKNTSRAPLLKFCESDRGIKDDEASKVEFAEKTAAKSTLQENAETEISTGTIIKATSQNSGEKGRAEEEENEKNLENLWVQPSEKSSTVSIHVLCDNESAKEEQNLISQQNLCLGFQETDGAAGLMNYWDKNEMIDEEDEEVVEEEEGDEDYYHVGITYDWFNDICRPRSYWEDLRKAWYLEVLNTDSAKEDIRQLVERRTVSNFLSSDLRERIDRLMLSRMQKQVDVESSNGEDFNEQWLAYSQQGSFLSQEQEYETACDVGTEKEIGQEPEKNQEQEMDEGKRKREGTTFSQQFHEAASDRLSQASSQTSEPSLMRSWSYRDHEADDDTDRTACASPAISLPSQSQSYNRNNDDEHSSFPSTQPSADIDIICDLKAQMEQLQREMLELRKSIKGCVEMQAHFQKSTNLETPSGESKNSLKRKCCICSEAQVDSLLYRCGHICTCLKCAHELQWRNGKCPKCLAPIADVVRVFLDQ